MNNCFVEPKKVGDQDEKLAEGIKLYAIPTTSTSKRTILGDLVTVCDFFFGPYLCESLILNYLVKGTLSVLN